MQLDAHDPYEILGVMVSSSAEDIRNAYLAGIAQFPPDRSPQEFEKIRDAYDVLSNPQRHAELILGADPRQCLADVLKSETKGRKFVGPDKWLNLLNSE